MSETKLNPDLTRKMAHLARLDLTDEEIQTFTSQLEEIVKYIDLLQQADVTGVEPMIHPTELETPLREDVVQPSPITAQGEPKVLEHAPDVMNGGFKVPPIL